MKAERPPPAPRRQTAFKLGLSAESRAAEFLRAQGFTIDTMRWRCPAGEIDIVARQKTLLVFVEVKARRRLDDAAYSVTPRQKRRIATAAAVWLAAHPADAANDMRFDVILVSPQAEPVHIPGAFEAA
jgi:putative endonuclease